MTDQFTIDDLIALWEEYVRTRTYNGKPMLRSLRAIPSFKRKRLVKTALLDFPSREDWIRIFDCLVQWQTSIEWWQEKLKNGHRTRLAYLFDREHKGKSEEGYNILGELNYVKFYEKYDELQERKEIEDKKAQAFKKILEI